MREGGREGERHRNSERGRGREGHVQKDGYSFSFPLVYFLIRFASGKRARPDPAVHTGHRERLRLKIQSSVKGWDTQNQPLFCGHSITWTPHPLMTTAPHLETNTLTFVVPRTILQSNQIKTLFEKFVFISTVNNPPPAPLVFVCYHCPCRESVCTV